MIKHKALVAVTAVAAVLIGATTVSATGNQNGGYKDCYEHDNEVTLQWPGDKDYSEKEYEGKHHKYPRRKKCHKPQVCEYNPQLPKWSKDCVKPEEPQEPETPTVPEQPQQPVQPAAPVVTPTAATVETVENPAVVTPTECLKSC